jgi:hypothetical protein
VVCAAAVSSVVAGSHSLDAAGSERPSKREQAMRDFIQMVSSRISAGLTDYFFSKVRLQAWVNLMPLIFEDKFLSAQVAMHPSPVTGGRVHRHLKFESAVLRGSR